MAGCMSNECRRVIMLQCICTAILQIGENICISCQTSMYTGIGVVAIHFLPESQYPGKQR